MPLVSIIVPVYKSEPYLRECLDSVIHQTFEGWECLLIEDGSPDSCGAICDEYVEADARFRVFHMPNRGVSMSRNIGLENAIGEWVLFLDSDDCLYAEALEICIDTVNTEHADIVQFSLNRNRDLLGSHDGISTNAVSADEYERLNKCQVCAGGSFLSINIIRSNKLSFDSSLRLAEDQLFMFQYMSCCNSLIRIDNCLYWYREHQGSATSKQSSYEIEKSIVKILNYKQDNYHFVANVDRTVVYFLVDLILNQDVPKRRIKQLTREAKLKNDSLLKGTYKFYYSISKISCRLAISFVRCKYYLSNKWKIR